MDSMNNIEYHENIDNNQHYQFNEYDAIEEYNSKNLIYNTHGNGDEHGVDMNGDGNRHDIGNGNDDYEHTIDYHLHDDLVQSGKNIIVEDRVRKEKKVIVVNETVVDSSESLESSSCYSYHHIKNESGYFDDSVDATYVIHLENNGRLDSIFEQLSLYKPTQDVFILYNKGYKKCKKPSFIKYPSMDLVDAYINVFKHSRDNGFKNILVLEDDFFFNEKVKNIGVQNDINTFIKSQNDDAFVYMLGTIPWWRIPVSTTSSRVLLSTGTHSCIYSKAYIDKIILYFDKNYDKVFDWDYFINVGNFTWNRYMYNKPLCYQLFTDTDNSKTWGNLNSFIDSENNFFMNKFITFFRSVFISFLNLLNLNKSVNPGYIFCYIFSIVLGTATVLLGLFFIGLIIVIVIYFTIGRKVDVKKIIQSGGGGGGGAGASGHGSLGGSCAGKDFMDDVNGFFNMVVSKLS